MSAPAGREEAGALAHRARERAFGAAGPTGLISCFCRINIKLPSIKTVEPFILHTVTTHQKPRLSPRRSPARLTVLGHPAMPYLDLSLAL